MLARRSRSDFRALVAAGERMDAGKLTSRTTEGEHDDDDESD
jgi:hypothetical protein